MTGYAGTILEDMPIAPGMLVIHKPFEIDMLCQQVIGMTGSIAANAEIGRFLAVLAFPAHASRWLDAGSPERSATARSGYWH